MKNTRKTISYEFSSSESAQIHHEPSSPPQPINDSQAVRESKMLIALLILLFVLLVAVSVLLWVSSEGGYLAAAGMLN